MNSARLLRGEFDIDTTVKIIHENGMSSTVYLDTVCTSDSKRVSTYGVDMQPDMVKLFSISLALGTQPVCGAYNVFPLPAQWFDTYIHNELNPWLKDGHIMAQMEIDERIQILHTETQNDRIVSFVVHYHRENPETGQVENILNVFREGDSAQDQLFVLPVNVRTTHGLYDSWDTFKVERGIKL
jgi:hypothetical protein